MCTEPLLLPTSTPCLFRQASWWARAADWPRQLISCLNTIRTDNNMCSCFFFFGPIANHRGAVGACVVVHMLWPARYSVLGDLGDRRAYLLARSLHPSPLFSLVYFTKYISRRNLGVFAAPGFLFLFLLSIRSSALSLPLLGCDRRGCQIRFGALCWFNFSASPPVRILWSASNSPHRRPILSLVPCRSPRLVKYEI